MEEIVKVEEIEIVISSLDFYLIEKVRALRNSTIPKISQGTLSRKLDLSDGFVSKVESFKQKSKYNIQHINKIINIFNLKSYSDLFPKEVIKDDMVRIKIKVTTTNAFDEKSKKFRLTKSYQVLSKIALTEKEFDIWKLRNSTTLKQ